MFPISNELPRAALSPLPTSLSPENALCIYSGAQFGSTVSVYKKTIKLFCLLLSCSRCLTKSSQVSQVTRVKKILLRISEQDLFVSDVYSFTTVNKNYELWIIKLVPEDLLECYALNRSNLLQTVHVEFLLVAENEVTVGLACHVLLLEVNDVEEIQLR